MLRWVPTTVQRAAGVASSRSRHGGAAAVAACAGCGSMAMQQARTAVTFSMEDLVKARLHLGHAHGVNNPKMKDFILENKHGMSIIDLDKTVPLLTRALDLTRDISSRGGVVLFVGTRPHLETLVRRTAMSCGEYFVSKRWIGGSLTNTYRVLGGMQAPDLVLFFSLPVNQAAVKEVKDCMIPTVGIVDTDCDPDMVDYAVPANDDSETSVELLLDLFAQAVNDGKEELARHPEKSHRFDLEEYRRQLADAASPSSAPRRPRPAHRRDLTRMTTLDPQLAQEAERLARRDNRGAADNVRGGAAGKHGHRGRQEQQQQQPKQQPKEEEEDGMIPEDEAVAEARRSFYYKTRVVVPKTGGSD